MQVKDICNELDVRSLCHKILQNVSTLLNADRGSLFLVQGGGLSACQHDHHRPTSKRVHSPQTPHPSITVGCLSKDDHHHSVAVDADAATSTAAAASAAITAATAAATTTTTTALATTATVDQHGRNNNNNHNHHHHHHPHHSHHTNSSHLHNNRGHQSCNNHHVPNNAPLLTPSQIVAVAPLVEEAVVGGLIVGSPVGSTNVGSLAPKNAAAPHHFQGCQSKCLVSKLFDVCSRSTLQEMEKKKEIHIPWGTGIVGYVAESGEPVNIPDAYKVYEIINYF